MESKKYVLLLLGCVLFLLQVNWAAGEKFSTEKVSFEVKFKEEITSYKVFSAFVLPEEKINFQIEDRSDSEFALKAKDGILQKFSHRNWEWQAPSQKGDYQIKIIKLGTDEIMKINVFVMMPFKEMASDSINSYHIGEYPNAPPGFIEVTNQNRNIPLSPHFTLGEFLCKQAGGYPKYIILKERLLGKLEFLLEEVNARGYECSGFTVMSGYRTPFYNESIGNVKNSRHIYGDAADIYIDEDKDGIMDDLNRDGKKDYLDGAVLYDIIEDLSVESSYKPFIGGLGVYKSNYIHGPFIHVDTRGYKARWGEYIASAEKEKKDEEKLLVYKNNTK